MWRRLPSPWLYSVFFTSGGMSEEFKQFVNRVAGLIRKRKKRYCDVVRHMRTRVRLTTLIALRGYRRKKVKTKHETPLSEVSYDIIPAPIFFKFENSINYYMNKSSVTFQPCKTTMTYFNVLIDKCYCNMSYLMTTN